MTSLPGVPALVVVDVVRRRTPRRQLQDLQAVHLRHFPDYPHVVDELARGWSDADPDPSLVVHQWLLLQQGRPVGEFVFHTNVTRHTVVRQHLAVDADARAALPVGWLASLTDAVQSVGQVDAAAAGGVLWSLMSEVGPHHVAGWRRLGYVPLDIGYAEPVHGRGWADHGPPTFHHLTPVLHLTATGAALPLGAVAGEAVRAFLLDHYRLPEDEPTVAGILARAAALESRAPDGSELEGAILLAPPQPPAQQAVVPAAADPYGERDGRRRDEGGERGRHPGEAEQQA